MPEIMQTHDPRSEVLAGIAIAQHRMDINGIDTAVLVGGDGPPMVLLPGPGESALWWARVLPQLVKTHRVVAPDLPGTCRSGRIPGGIDADGVIAWLDALVSRTCDAPPVIVGHAIGGALAARYALRHPDKVQALVLVDSLGLRRFFPSPVFGFRLIRFMGAPTEARYGPFLDQCMYDAPAMKQGFGDRWDAFLRDYLAGMQDKERRTAVGDLIKHLGAKRIAGLDDITVPTTLIWGRNDKATPVKVAEDASRRYGWPLHVIERAGDDPKLERPQEFLEALKAALAR